jgi:hypothetical protein
MPSRVPIRRVRLWDSSARQQTLRFRKGDLAIPKTIFSGFAPNFEPSLVKQRWPKSGVAAPHRASTPEPRFPDPGFPAPDTFFTHGGKFQSPDPHLSCDRRIQTRVMGGFQPSLFSARWTAAGSQQIELDSKPDSCVTTLSETSTAERRIRGQPGRNT